MVLRSGFHVELQAHRELLVGAREILKGEAFPALWGKTLAIYDFKRCELISGKDHPGAREDVVLLRLDRHLEALSRGLQLQPALAQRPLFPAVALRRPEQTMSKAARA
jgi:hypothetical protein